MPSVNMHEAKTQLSKLVEALQNGDETEIIIARNGIPVAKLVRYEAQTGKRPLGIAKNLFPPINWEAFNAMDAEIEKLFYGEDNEDLEAPAKTGPKAA